MLVLKLTHVSERGPLCSCAKTMWVHYGKICHYSDAVMSAMASKITGVSIVCSTVCSGGDQRKNQSSASLAFVSGTHRDNYHVDLRQYVGIISFPIIFSTQRWHGMMTSSNGNIFRVTGPLCGEFTGPGEFPTQRPVTRNFDVFFDLRLSKQPWGWWFETLSWSLWRQCKGVIEILPRGKEELVYPS